MTVPGLSVIMITKNEEQRIERCLDSLNWASEIVVVDSGSSDRTREICGRYPAVRFYEHPWVGFGPQKNRALSLATGEWVFSIDADEVVSPELAAQIAAAVQRPAYDGYRVQRRNYYRGQWIRHSGWWPDPLLRLFRRSQGCFSDRPVHETVELQGVIGDLAGCLEHHSFSCVSDFIRKADSYSSLGAELLRTRGVRSSPALALLKCAATFFKTLVLKRGFLDGAAGVLIAYSNAAGVFYRYMKCYELQRGDDGKA